VLTSGLTGLYQGDAFREVPVVKLYVVLEQSESWGGAPDNTQDVLYGVFLSREAAEECLWLHVGYAYSQGVPKLTLLDGKATDDHGHIYMEIIEKEVDQCSDPAY
jgi:hypothetical protein